MQNVRQGHRRDSSGVESEVKDEVIKVVPQ